MKAVSVILLACSFLVLPGLVLGCVQEEQKSEKSDKIESGTVANSDETAKQAEEKKLETITLGAGCFWCVEAVFDELKGVDSVVSGYMGGNVPNPTYQQICTGQTWHAEVCQIKYDPEVITFPELLEVFWTTHDPTTLNQQGVDHGTQYRSAIFYSTDEQKKLSEEYLQKLNESGAFGARVVTEVTAASEFYVAEDYHQEYFANNGKQPYCKAVIIPKMKKFRKVFKDKLKGAEEKKEEGDKATVGKKESDK